VDAFDIVVKPVMRENKIPYLYIAGASYSGSTLLAFLLNAHPQIASLSEVAGPLPDEDLDTYLCSCGAPFLECPFYRELEKRINSLGSAFTLANWRTRFQVSRHRGLDIPLVRPLRNVPLEWIRDRVVHLWPDYRNTIDAIRQRNVHLAQALLEITGKRVYADAQKDPIRVKFLSEVDSFDLHVIHLIRDVRGAVNSIMRHNSTTDAAWSTRVWQSANMNAHRAKRFVPPEKWMRLRYDDLCKSPQDIFDQICDFTGCEHATIPEDFYQTDHHIIGNTMRTKSVGKITSDVSWKQSLSREDLDIISRTGGKMNRFFGSDWP
jgi:hypothetical protein